VRGWQAFVTSLVGSLAWPVAIVTLLLCLRRELAGLIARVTSGSLRLAGLELALQAEKAEKKAEPLFADPEPLPDLPLDHLGGEAVSPSAVGLESVDSPTSSDELLSMARRIPVAAIEQAWSLVETTLRDAVHDAGALMGVRSSGPYAWAHFLTVHDALPVGTADLVEQLHVIRDSAVARQHVEGPDVAITFVNTALRVLKHLRQVDTTVIRRQLHGSEPIR